MILREDNIKQIRGRHWTRAPGNSSGVQLENLQNHSGRSTILSKLKCVLFDTQFNKLLNKLNFNITNNIEKYSNSLNELT